MLPSCIEDLAGPPEAPPPAQQAATRRLMDHILRVTLLQVPSIPVLSGLPLRSESSGVIKSPEAPSLTDSRLAQTFALAQACCSARRKTFHLAGLWPPSGMQWQLCAAAKSGRPSSRWCQPLLPRIPSLLQSFRHLRR